jgi:hypothetical protein
MTTVQFLVSLPDQLAEEARQAGLLSPEAIESMLREKLRRQHLEELRDSMDRMQATDEPPMTLEQIAAAVKEYRQERRRASGS